MGLRFRKSVKLAPGVKINLSKSGVSTSLGGRGAFLSVGSKGVYTTAGLSGTGLSSRTKLGGGSKISYALPAIDVNLMHDEDNAEYVQSLANASNAAVEEVINISRITPRHKDKLCYN